MRQALGRGVRALYQVSGIPPQPLVVTRCIQIHADATTANGDHLPVVSASSGAASPDARFEVIGAPYSLLSASLSASQNLYTQRGTLVGLSGKADNVVSRLSILEPVRRALLGIPFLYQKISSATPVTALITVRSPLTSFTVVHLDGTVDWMIAQRRALLAWTGHSLSIRPTINAHLSVAHWGDSGVTGRGLLALVGHGQIYSIKLKAGEQYIVHPSHVIAYTTLNSHRPRPYRFKSTSLRFQVPELHLSEILSRSKFIRDMAGSDTWKTAVRWFHHVRTWARRTIWGDRLFLQFDGPTTILVQSRGARVRDVLNAREVNEIANAPAGARDAIEKVGDKLPPGDKSDCRSRNAEPPMNEQGIRPSIAILRDGKVEFQRVKEKSDQGKKGSL
ncbi:hypothetical protein Egran_01349 [Elaphomyces granulatus]|uniref:Altered inheritance of mitochondria protein 24, mitochondrial n=1 Tax=Elaphomyces granulatus TaxID=519963 RepID=A0A232M3D1_9EURO|nr:hypothetical protein Egran_01349 [Elaphomyces granulatus]